MKRIETEQQRLEETASRTVQFTSEQIHALLWDNRMSQFQFRRRCDRYLLAFCLCVLALAASILWHTAPWGVTVFNAVVVVLSVAVVWVAVRAACSLWLMRQTLRLRAHPDRMSKYTDRLNRLSRRRRRWIGFVLRNGFDSTPVRGNKKSEFISLRLPSYSIAASLLMFIAINSDKAFAATRDYTKVTTTSEKADAVICSTVNNIMSQL